MKKFSFEIENEEVVEKVKEFLNNLNMALVEIEEGAILSSGDQVHIPLSIDDVDNFEVGDQVRIGYDGSVMESYPLQINMTFIEKVDE